MSERILVIGTFDTKSDELQFLSERIREAGGEPYSMDVSVLGDASTPVDVSKHEVARAAGSSIPAAIESGDENAAMQIMARGASRTAAALAGEGRIDAMAALGGTMGTDLALDCARALPLGFPKYVISTVAFSPLIPAGRLAPDIQMILWAGGLSGLNSVCRSSLAQAAGAVVGAARAARPPAADRPVVGMTSLGSSCLSYMNRLRGPLEERGFETAIFHATGMGGMAFERLARESYFAAVMDFALPELGNLLFGSVVHAGPDRLTSAGKAGIPQLVAPGCADLIDLAGWQPIPERHRDRPFHAHNRLIKSTALAPDERRELVRDIVARLRTARGPVHLLLPLRGVEEWDREGQPAHDPAGLAAMMDEFDRAADGSFETTRIDCHINDREFAEKALEILDGWREAGAISA